MVRTASRRRCKQARTHTRSRAPGMEIGHFVCSAILPRASAPANLDQLTSRLRRFFADDKSGAGPAHGSLAMAQCKHYHQHRLRRAASPSLSTRFRSVHVSQCLPNVGRPSRIEKRWCHHHHVHHQHQHQQHHDRPSIERLKCNLEFAYTHCVAPTPPSLHRCRRRHKCTLVCVHSSRASCARAPIRQRAARTVPTAPMRCPSDASSGVCFFLVCACALNSRCVSLHTLTRNCATFKRRRRRRQPGPAGPPPMLLMRRHAVAPFNLVC